LLVGGKFPRFAAALAVVATILLALDLMYLRATPRGLFLSNFLGFVVVLLAAACSFHVARRCNGFKRQLWMLLVVALALESIGQGLTTYYQSFDRAALAGALPSDIFFFVWAAPIFMIFLPPSDDEEESGFDWLRTLDFVQVGIVAVALYLYFFFVPTRWLRPQYSILSGILFVYIGRDALLAVSFYARSRGTVPEWFRSFCRILAVAFALAACSDAIYLLQLEPAAEVAKWGDLFFVLPYLVIVALAITWKAPQATSLPVPRSKLGDFFARRLLPIVLPLLVILLAHAIAREQFALAWAAVVVSVLCSSVRLMVTNRRTRRVAEHLLSAEKALRTSEEMLSTAFRASPDAFSINIFPNGPYLEVNEGFTRLTGYTREETIKKTPGQMSLWVDMRERDKVLENLAKNGTARDVEFRFRTKSGQIRTGQMSVGLVELDGRKCALVVVRDITVRKEAEEILRSNEERFRSLVQNLHVGILTFGADGKVMFANQAAVGLLNFPLEQIVGKVPSEMGLTPLAEDGSVMPQEARPVPRVIATRKPLRSFTMGWRREETGNEVWTLLDAVPEYTATGELLRVVVSVTNITEQRRAVEALRESEERFRTLVSELHVAVALHQPDGRIEYVNPALMRMLELPDLSVIPGKLPSELGIVALSEDGRELREEERPVSLVARTKTAARDVLLGYRLRSSGKTKWVFGSTVPHLDANGNLVRVITSFMDMTEHRRALEALRESEERFRTLVRDLHVAVVLHRPDLSIEFANAAAYRMFDVPEGEATGKAVADYGLVMCDENGVELPLEKDPVVTVFGSGTPIPNGLLGFRRAGIDKVLWVFGNVVPQFDAHGKVIRAIATFADISEMRNAERAIHQLSTQLMRLQDEERRRLGRELHDGLAQTVLAINLSLAQVRQSLKSEERAGLALEKARALTQQMSREIRTLSYLLHPPLLDELGLVSALREYAHGFSERSSIETQLQVLTEFSRLPQELELTLFRVVQESLANIQRHSGSNTAEIRLRQEGELVTLEIRDYGRGMVVPFNGSSSGARLGVGIAGMRERMSQLGGRLEILSGSGGTTVRATISLGELKLGEAVADLAGKEAQVES
jgi:PAS domain S-box-containing protein